MIAALLAPALILTYQYDPAKAPLDLKPKRAQAEAPHIPAPREPQPLRLISAGCNPSYNTYAGALGKTCGVTVGKAF